MSLRDALIALAYLIVQPDGPRLIFRGRVPLVATIAVHVLAGLLIAEWWAPLPALPSAAIGLWRGPRSGGEPSRFANLGGEWDKMVALGATIDAVFIAVGVLAGTLAGV